MVAAMPPNEEASNVTSAEPSHQAMEQAAEWYALLKSEEVAGGDKNRWKNWLESSAEHRRAWQYVESVSSRFAPIHDTPDPRRTADGLWEANTRVIQRRRVLTTIAGLAGAGLLGWGSWRHTPLPLITRNWQSDYHTATGETREVLLTDGTRVWLNTASAINQKYDSRERRLHLVSGEILIDTAADSRPFYVETVQGKLQSLGTRFTVRLDGEQTFLAVYEGAVKVNTRSDQNTVLQAGQQIQFTQNTLADVKTADIAREAWSRGVLVAQDIPLHQVVDELRRYRKGHLGLAPEVAELRVFGNFPLNDTDDALDMIADALPVRISRTLPWWVSIENQD